MSIPSDMGRKKKKKTSASKKAGGAARVHTVNKSNFTGGVGGLVRNLPLRSTHTLQETGWFYSSHMPSTPSPPP